MRKVILLFCLAISASAFAQDLKAVRGSCTPAPENGGGVAEARAGMTRRLPTIISQWDASRVYRQLVILVAFKGDDTNFAMENPKETYDQMLNGKGYNQRQGKGCMAEYFRDQSNGMLNLQFDVYGPYQVSQKAQPYANPDGNTTNYGRDALVEATNLFLAENPDIDFSQYDWNNNGHVNQVVYITAGYAGNAGSPTVYGYIWPNTSTFTTITTPDGKKISNYTCSGELWPNNTSCGIGTICHEFTHSLGLPDIYPTSSSAGYSVCDEWDLMDGGNFTNYGWCPPNYTALEKMLLGWAKPVELTEPTSIKNLKPLEEGGDFYRIKHSESEWLLLENRQQRGWDAGAPGQGLVIYHVNYDGSVWRGNTVNNNKGKFRFELVHADNMSYDDWDDWVMEHTTYRNSGHMNNYHLSTSPYPWTNESSVVNNLLTDNSVPAATMYYNNEMGEIRLSKPITNITMSDDGLVSFDFMGGSSEPTVAEGIKEVVVKGSEQRFDFSGRRLQGHPRANMYIVREADGSVKKVVK